MHTLFGVYSWVTLLKTELRCLAKINNLRVRTLRDTISKESRDLKGKRFFYIELTVAALSMLLALSGNSHLDVEISSNMHLQISLERLIYYWISPFFF